MAAKDYVSSRTELPGSAILALALVAMGEGAALIMLYLRNPGRRQEVVRPEHSRHEETEGQSLGMLRSRNVFAHTEERLRREIEALARRAALNLALGVVISFIGAGILAYLAFTLNASVTNINSFLPIFVPRLTTALFLEVFAFFFLRLYKSNLSEIKYYQNELTDLALQEISLEVVGESGDASLRALVAEQFAKSRRNLSAEAVGRSIQEPGEGGPEGTLSAHAVKLVEAIRKNG